MRLPWKTVILWVATKLFDAVGDTMEPTGTAPSAAPALSTETPKRRPTVTAVDKP